MNYFCKSVFGNLLDAGSIPAISTCNLLFIILDLLFMDKEELKARTKRFALRVINLVNVLPNTKLGNVIGSQLLRSGTSVGANYRATCLGKSKADFISKLGTVIEEADESAYWMELIIKSNLMSENLIKNLLNEAYEIVAIMVSSRKLAMKNK